jgi:hypothetical protein
VHYGVASGHVIMVTSMGKVELSEIGRISLGISRQNLFTNFLYYHRSRVVP